MEEDVLYKKYRKKRRVIIFLSIAILSLLYMFKNASFLLRSLSAVGLLVLFYLADHLFNLDFQEKHYLFVIFIAVSSFLFSPLYYIYPQYDKIQHFVQPMMLASIVFHMVDKLNLEKKWKIVFVFFVVIGSIGVFEIGEYTLDMFFDLKLQGVFLRNIQGLEKLDILLDRIDDTMIDMALGVLGAVVYSFFMGFILRKSLSQHSRKSS